MKTTQNNTNLVQELHYVKSHGPSRYMHMNAICLEVSDLPRTWPRTCQIAQQSLYMCAFDRVCVCCL